jgi:hypothetical protein
VIVETTEPFSSSSQKVKYIRKIDECTTQEFQEQISKETWQNVFDACYNDVNYIYNSFLNTYLQIFYSCFPKTKIVERPPTNQWITKGIIISCKKKKDLYLLVKHNDDENLKNYIYITVKFWIKLLKLLRNYTSTKQFHRLIIRLKQLGIS